MRTCLSRATLALADVQRVASTETTEAATPDTGPLVVGLIVTVVSAIVGYFMTAQLARHGVGSDFTEPQTNTVRLRLQRDLDAVQVAAGAVAFTVASVIHEGQVSLLDPSVLIALSAAVPIGGTLLLLQTRPETYDRYSLGLLTPLTTLLTVAYAGALLLAA